MYALNLGPDGRVLSATTVNYAPAGSTFVPCLPDGDVIEYRYTDGEYIHDPLPKAEPVAVVTIASDELAVLQEKAAAHDILVEGGTSE